LRYNRVIHTTFRVGVIAKGIDGFLEIIGGVLLLLLRPETIGELIFLLTEHELSTDPRDIIANYLLRSAGHLSGTAKLFGSLYLLSHGIIKILLVISLLNRKLWAYPAAIIFFILFIIYQLYRYSFSHSPWMIFLSVFDAAIVVLTWAEYKVIRGETAA
jgi:uncharacterized membrane protein